MKDERSDIDKALDISGKRVIYNGVLQPTREEKIEITKKSIMDIIGCDELSAYILITAISQNQIKYIGWRDNHEN